MQICGHNASRMVSPITLAVVSEDGRGKSARIEIVEAARGAMQLAGRSGDVRSWRQSGRHMLVWSFSVFDPGCVKTCTSQECAELFSLSSSLSSGRKHFWFSNLRNREGVSTRRLNVGVFTRPRPTADIGSQPGKWPDRSSNAIRDAFGSGLLGNPEHRYHSSQLGIIRGIPDNGS